MLVIGALRDRDADLVQLRRPVEEIGGTLERLVVGGELLPQRLRKVRHALRLGAIDVVAARELLHRHLADVAVVHAPQGVPENALVAPLGDGHLVNSSREDPERPRRPGDHRDTVLARPSSDSFGSRPSKAARAAIEARGGDPVIDTPFFIITSASDLAVPEEPTASFQPSSEAIGDRCTACAAASAPFIPFLSIFPPAKNREV